MRRAIRGITVGAALSWAGLLGMPAAQAAPAAAVDQVFALPCAHDVCDTSADTPLSSGDIVTGRVQIQVHGSSSVGLSSLRIESRLGTSGAWSCLRHWDTSASSYSTRYNWDTTAWPEFCPDGANSGLTSNGVYQIRVTAKESVSNASTSSSIFTLKVNDLPSVPQWAAQPAVTGESDNQPVVELRWHKVPEPDVREYHYVRTDPNGQQTEFAVSAARPGGQGCDTDGDQYVCYDDYFPSSGYTGDYHYELLAFRSSPATGNACSLSSGNCVASDTPGPRYARVTQPPAPVIQKTGGGSKDSKGTRTTTHHTVGHVPAGDRPTYCDFYCGKYSKTLPYGQRPVVVDPNATTGSGNSSTLASDSLVSSNGIDKRKMWVSLAGGLLMMLAAVHIMRLLRDRAT